MNRNDMEASIKYEVLATRLSGSVFGAAQSVCKDKDGKPLEFETEQAASDYKEQLTANLKTSNVVYAVQAKLS